MKGYFCNCGFYARTLAGLRRHATKCVQASAKLRRAEDHARTERIERAKKINDAARAEAWLRVLGREPP